MFATNVISSGLPRSSQRKTWDNIFFSEEDAFNIKPHDDDPLVITVQHENGDIKHILIDPGSSANVQFWDAFQKLQLDPNDIKIFSGSLMGLSGKHIQIVVHITLKTTCGEGADGKEIDVIYLFVDALSPYNIILGWPNINSLGVLVSTMYLTLKYPLLDRRVGTIW